MSEREEEFTIHLNSLLKTYSVKDITDLFTKIDKRLISLHNKSAEDFLQLNKSYKEIYSQSNRITNNVGVVCNTSNINKNNNLYQIINELYEKLKIQFEVLDYRIVVISDQLEKLSNHIRHIFFPIKSYSQNLMSLNYLIANLKVSLSYSKGSENEYLENIYLQTEKLIESIKLITDNIINSFNQLSKIAKSSYKRIKDLNGLHEVNLESLLKEIQSSIELIDKKNEDNKNLIPNIKEKIGSLENSNTEIVKKLQYQDIIKQKMEHIQNTHKDLIKELVEFNETNLEANKLNEKVKCFLRIRDISGLQAAQLIQANKEYQSAIEVIIDNFILIGDNIQEITYKSQRVYSYGKVNYNRMFERIDSYINKANLFIDNYNHQTKILDAELNNIHDKYLQSENIIENFRKSSFKLEELLNESKKYFEELFNSDSNLKKANSQFINLLKETKDNSQKLNSLYDYLFTLKDNIEGFVNKTDQGLLSETNFSELRTQIDLLKASGNEIETLLQNNNNDSKVVIKNIKNSISRIKYYEYFEKVIQEIITELNTVNYKLKLNKELDGISREENLENIKQYYTMETEHNIHDKVAKGEEAEIDFDIKEDDEIEFF